MPKAETPTKLESLTKRKTVKKRVQAALSSCPVNGAGWCPYPFSIEQLERRLKERAALASHAASKKTGTSKNKAHK